MITTTEKIGRRRPVTVTVLHMITLQPTLGWLGDRPNGRWTSLGTRFRADGINNEAGIPFVTSI